MSANEQVIWRRHPVSPKWHAFRPEDGERVATRPVGDGSQVSACGLTSRAVGDGLPEAPPWPDACWRCCQELGVKTSGTRPTAPRAPEPQAMCVEFIGGPYDGIRLRDLQVVMRDAMHMTVVGQSSYTVKTKPTMSSEVEDPAKRMP